MPFWRRPSAIWGGTIAVLLATMAFVGYLRLRPAVGMPPANEQVVLVAALGLLTALLTGKAVRSAWHRRLDLLTQQVAAMAADPDSLPLSAIPEEFRAIANCIDDLVRRQRENAHQQQKTIEILQKEQQMAEITLQSLLGRADAEEGQSHSLIHRRGTDGTAGGTREMIARLAPNLSWLAATPAMQKFLGWTIVELNGRSILEYVHPEDTAALREAFDRALRHGEGHSIEARLQLRGGTERNVQIDVLTRYTTDNKPLHLRCHFLDITERIRSDHELRLRTEQLSQTNERLQRINRDLERLKESYRDLYHNAPVLYFSLDPLGHIASCNETMLRALGFQRDDLHDQPYTNILPPEGRQQFMQRPDLFQRAGEVETKWMKRDGTVLDVWIRTTPVLDADGKFIRSRSAAQEVTERNRLANALRAQAEELQRANEQLRRINRELDDFTYVVSHDLKEPLRTLQAFSNFLAEDYGDKLGDEGKEFIAHLIAASKRLGTLIDDLLNLSRAGRVISTTQTFDIGSTVNTVRGDLASLLQRRNAVLRTEGSLPAVAGDPQRIAQLLTNLISNGLKYNQSATPEVTVGVYRPHNGAGTHLKAEDAGRIVFYVRDNGIGIEPRFHAQIFGIFRRLHLPEEYEGTGAGLAICKKIVEAHGGRIWVESQPGQGATFYFTLSPPLPHVTPLPPARAAGRATMVHLDAR